MSMAMRRQLGMAPNKSPSKASSAAGREAHPSCLHTIPSRDCNPKKCDGHNMEGAFHLSSCMQASTELHVSLAPHIQLCRAHETWVEGPSCCYQASNIAVAGPMLQPLAAHCLQMPCSHAVVLLQCCRLERTH